MKIHLVFLNLLFLFAVGSAHGEQDNKSSGTSKTAAQMPSVLEESAGSGTLKSDSEKLINGNGTLKTDSDKANEQLVVLPPNGWARIYQINTPTTRLSDFVPPDQDAANWTTKLSIESYSTEILQVDPIDLLLSEAIEDERKCDFVQHFNIFSGYENGYESSVRLFLCGENQFSQQGEIKLAKSIKGADYIYSVRFTQRMLPFALGKSEFTDEEIAVWSTFLNDVMVCDDSAEHPCQK